MTLLDRLRAAGHAAIDAHRQVMRAPSPEMTPLERQRAVFRAGLVPATPESVALALRGPALTPEQVAAAEAAARDRRTREEAERLRRTRVRVEIDLSAGQWLLLVKHGHDPLLPPNGTRKAEPQVVHGSLIGRVDGRPVYEPLRSGVCELEGVEIDGHEPSDLDPFGGCMWCGKQDIYGDGPGDRDEWDRLDLDDEEGL